MFGIDLTTIAGLLVLAGGSVTCTVPEAPEINITPLTADIRYEFSLPGSELDKLASNTVNPYDPGIDTSTGGLRHDKPKITTEVLWGTEFHRDKLLSCMWYKTINVKIELSPKIYIARENTGNPVCRNAIMEHEHKHVAADREVINKYAQGIGRAVKQAVDKIGPMGPYNLHQVSEVQDELIGHIQTAVDSQKFLLYQEMSRRQTQIDSLEEYERVNTICKESKK